MLRFLKWVGGTELMITVKDKHHVEIVDFDTYVREQSQRQRAEQHAQSDELIP